MHNKISSEVKWSCPSNIAIIKYWGKKGEQEPMNASISFTLSNAITTTKVSAIADEDAGFSFFMDGQPMSEFNKKVELFLEKCANYLPFIRTHHLKIDSTNSFPHSSGIASSASSMSALAFCLADLHNISIDKANISPDLVLTSALARLGSGSACRSVYAGWTAWGKCEEISESSDMYAVKIPEHEISSDFRTIKNAILIIDHNKKSVSSSVGHSLMNNHPYKDARIKQSYSNAQKLLEVLKSNNWNQFFTIAENEALSLHGLMMSSTPSYTLMHPNTLIAISKIRKARENDNLPVGFTLDAGPNIHLLYPQKHEVQVKEWVKQEMEPLCSNNTIIFDAIGGKPHKLLT